MKINIVCVKWGDLYSHEYVNRLYSMVKRNITIEFDFFCITENSSNIRKEVTCIPCPISWVKNQWYKESMFVPGTIPERMTLYLDLDVVIVSNIDDLIPKDDSLWCISRDFNKRNVAESIPVFHGAVMAFNPKYWYSFFNFFESKVKNNEIEMKRGREQPLIALYHHINKHKNLHVYPNNWIWSFKYGHLRDPITVENQYIYRGYKPPIDGKICSFHGWPNPDEVLNLEYIDNQKVNWITENWIDN